MAKRPRPSEKWIYPAFERFVDSALRRDGSLFDPETTIWSVSYLTELKENFVEQPDESSRSFEEKLASQLSNVSDPAKQLMAELLCVHLLVTIAVGGDKKREIISTVLGWMSDPPEIPSDLGDALNQGLIHPGTFYSTGRPFLLWFLIRFGLAWKAQSPEQVARLLDDPWAFKELVWSLEVERAYSQREILLHIVHPETFEAISSRKDKKALVERFSEYVTQPGEDIDRSILEIRKGLQSKLGRTIDFYDDDVRALWKPTEAEPEQTGSLRSSLEEILSGYEEAGQSGPFSKKHAIWKVFTRLAGALRSIPAISANSQLLVEPSAGKGNWANVPWVAIMDRRETTTVQRGIYVVYLFREDMSGVYLTLNQGVTETIKELGRSKGRGALEERANEIRQKIAGGIPAGFVADPEFDLRTRSNLGSNYEASTIVSKFYGRGNVPDDATLADDASTIVRVYEDFLGTAPSTETGVWLFQANPKIFDLRGACKTLQELRFDVRQSHKQINKGDRVYLWESGSRGGIVAVGEVLTEPDPLPFAPGEEPFIRDASKFSADQPAVRIRLETVLEPVVSRDRARAVPGLEKLGVLTFPQATNYRVSQEEDAILRRLVDSVAPLPIEGDLPTVVEEFSGALHDAGLRFGAEHQAVVRSFLAALATKRFAILTGLSGSGKTQLGLSLGRWFGERRYRVIPVRPDWTGPEALLGYADALQEAKEGRRAWHTPEALEFVLRAAADPVHPHLLLLDEMNLAHVERYFADVLSGMESNEPCIPNVRRGPDGLWREVEKSAELLVFPRNVFVVGTVNVDETTYMFSPKVLDRANTFEFRVEADDLVVDLQSPDPCAPGPGPLVRYYLQAASNDGFQETHPASERQLLANHLKALHRVLATAGFEFGHRVFYEALRFAAYLEAAGESDALTTLDRIVMQKLMPRLHGSYRRLHALLADLGRYAYELDVGSEIAGGAAFDPEAHVAADAKLPRTFAKIQRMTRSLRANQFVSFTE